MWYYWYCQFGPGFQGFNDGFKFFHESYGKSDRDADIKSMFEDKFDHSDQWSGDYWSVENVPQQFLDKKAKKIKEKIEYLKQDLKFYQEQKGSVVKEESGVDEKISQSIKDRPACDILKKLHKAGIVIDKDTLSSWAVYYPERNTERCKKPIEVIRDKILKIVRRVKTYSSYN